MEDPSDEGTSSDNVKVDFDNPSWLSRKFVCPINVSDALLQDNTNYTSVYPSLPTHVTKSEKSIETPT